MNALEFSISPIFLALANPQMQAACRSVFQRALTECHTERSLRTKNLNREDILVMQQAEARESDHE